MSNKMLIDAVHPEETRVVVLKNKRVEDFDFEAASKRPLRGNIYLAKVTRVEPSLQAAFIEYGGGRHGFLAFSEIHPDYYQIPQADRQALIAEMEEEAAEAEAPAKPARRKRASRAKAADAEAASETVEAAPQDEAPVAEAAESAPVTDAPEADESASAVEADAADDEPAPAAEAEEPEVQAAAQEPAAEEPAAEAPAAEEPAAQEPAAEEPPAKPKRRRRATTKKSDDGLADPAVNDEDEDDTVTAHGNQDAMEEIPERKRRAPRRNYKIQEVIKRRQILLVQVVKEERGTKGAALTTYLSLAGRYSVLMPNTNRGGGVSRKITDNADRKRLKSLVAELDVPEGMGIILRTAGASRTKTEIKRDFEYLLRLWESVRELTLQSIAPQLVYEEGNLVKRSIRDLYSKEIDEVLVSGEAAYREAKDFMKMLMPSHAKNVQLYKEVTPIFTAYQVEGQLDSMFSPTVTLPSKGSIVISPTEALVAIDVNSGKSNKESNIEDTATKTNLEAADEVARQLRLRDLAGLIVIDFIDMDDKRHNRQVEKRLKDALKMDRSRIQVGRISPFGLMEMSRQRIRQGMVETSMVPCPHCQGTGMVRSTQSVALFCLRALEEHLLKHADRHVTIRTSSAVALYILNQKRTHLNDLEDRFGLEVGVHADETLQGQLMEIKAGEPVTRDEEAAAPPTTQLAPDALDMDEEAEEPEGGERSGRRRRRRRRRGGSAGDEGPRQDEAAEAEASDADEAEADSERADDEADDGRRGRRRRGRRGGRRHRREDELAAEEAASTEADASPEAAAPDAPAPKEATGDAPAPPAPLKAESTVPSIPLKKDEPVVASAPVAAEDEDETPPEDEDASAPVPAPEQKAAEPARPRRAGWWQRRSFF
ncbi:MAG: ribonuclease E/G [Pseudomonadota bacterium]